MKSIPSYCPICFQKEISIWSIAKDYEYQTSNDTFTYYKCDHCNCLFIHPTPEERLKEIYPANYYSFINISKNFVTRIKEWLDKKFFRKQFKKITANEINVLDIGGGTGWMIDLLKQADKRINYSQIVDIDTKAKELAEQNGYNYFEGRIEDFNTDKKFHLILMLNLIEHVADPLTVLRKAGSLLEDNGIIIIKTPNSKSWDARLFKKTYWGGLHCPRHWVIFSEKNFRLLVNSAQLNLKKLYYTQGAPFWAFSIIALLHRKKIIKISSEKPIIYHWLFPPLSAFFAFFDFVRRPFAKTSQMFIVLSK